MYISRNERVLIRIVDTFSPLNTYIVTFRLIFVMVLLVPNNKAMPSPETRPPCIVYKIDGIIAYEVSEHRPRPINA